MRIVCAKCSAAYEIDDNRIPPSGLTMKCPSCLFSFPVRRADAPAAAPPPAAATRPAAGPVGTFDLDGPDPFAGQDSDLPAPRGFFGAAPAAPAADDLPAPKRAPGPPVPPGAPPRAAPPRAPGNELDLDGYDLPAAGGQGEGLDLGEIDLPAPRKDSVPPPTPRGAQPPPIPRRPPPPPPQAQAPAPPLPQEMSLGDIDLPGTPRHRASGDMSFGELDLGADADLPAPAQSNIDLPAPSLGVDLPAPSRGVDLPAPSSGVGLPGPSQGVGLPGPRAGGATFGDLPGLEIPDDLGMEPPPPSFGQGRAPAAAAPIPEMPLDAFSLDGAGGLPAGPGSQRLHIDLDAIEQRAEDVPDMDVSAPPEMEDAEAGNLAALEEPPAETKKKKKDKEDKKKGKKEKVPKGVAARPARSFQLSRRMVALAGGALAALLAVGGVAFYIFVLNKPGEPEQKLLSELHVLVQADLYPSYLDAAKKVRAKADADPKTPDLRAIEAQMIAMAGLIHGDSGVLLKDVDGALSKYQEQSQQPSTHLLRARAWRAALAEKDAGKLFQAALRARPSDVFTLLGLGWSALQQNKLKDAEDAFKKILVNDGNRVAAHYGMARVLEARGDQIAGRDSYLKVLQFSPSHFGANLALARAKASPATLSDEIQKVLQQYGKMAAPAELAQAWCVIGEAGLADGKNDEAEASFKQALTFDAASIRAANGLAHALIEQGRITDALARLLETKKAERANSITHLLLARIYLLTERPADARASVQVAEEQSPGDPRTQVMVGRIEEASEAPGATDKAVAAYNEAMKRDPRHVDAYTALARLYARVGKRDAATATLKQAEEQVPDSVEIPITRGHIAMMFKEYEAARKEFEAALAKAPVNAARFGLGSAYEATEKLEEARMEYEKVLETAKSYPGVAERLGRLYMKLGRPAEAEKIFDDNIKRESASLPLKKAAAQAFFELERFEKVLPLVDDVLIRDPRASDAYHLKARTLHRMGKLEDALRACKRAQSVQPKAEYYQECGLVLVDDNKPGEAMEEFQRAIEKDPSLYEARIEYAKLLIRRRQMNEALRQLDAAKKVVDKRDCNSCLAGIFKAEGMAFRELGKKKEAIRSYGRAVELDPKDGVAWFHYGEVLEIDNQFSQALRAFESCERSQGLPKDVVLKVNFKLGQAYEYAGNKSRACHHYTRFMELAPENDASRPDAVSKLRVHGCK